MELPRRCEVCRKPADPDSDRRGYLCPECKLLIEAFDRDLKKLRRAANVLERRHAVSLYHQEAASLRIGQT